MDNVPKFAKNNKVKSEYEELLPIIELDDDQKFTDSEGDQYNITMRGERFYNKCYFKVSDISKIFEMKSLYTTLLDNRGAYKKNKHYKYFINTNLGKSSNYKIKKFLYLTYRGVIKCLFNNNNKKAESFQDWCLKTLFIHQFGTIEEKHELSSKLLGVHAKTVRKVFNTASTTTPCVYLFTLGTVKDLRKTMQIDKKYNDNMIICKYGMTDSLERRAYEHNKLFKTINNVNLCLKYYAYIDPQFISKAEVDIKDYFEAINCKYEYDNYKELIILDSTKMNKLVKQQFSNLSNMYAGHVKDIIKKIKDLENKLLLQSEKYKNELLIEKNKNELLIEKHNNELLIEKNKNELLIEKNKNEIQKYEIELLKKELQITKMIKK